MAPNRANWAPLRSKMIINSNNHSEVQAKLSFLPESHVSRGDPEKGSTCMNNLISVVMCMFITSVLCVPRGHMPLLLIIHLSSNIILDLVIISEFLYL